MTDHLLEVPDKEKVYWEEIEERREASQRETQGKHKVVAEDKSSNDEEEHVPLAAELAPTPTLAPQINTKIKIKVKMDAPEKNIPAKYKEERKSSHPRRKKIQFPSHLRRDKRRSREVRAFPDLILLLQKSHLSRLFFCLFLSFCLLLFLSLWTSIFVQN